jgi:hypothetical protein
MIDVIRSVIVPAGLGIVSLHLVEDGTCVRTGAITGLASVPQRYESLLIHARTQ